MPTLESIQARPVPDVDPVHNWGRDPVPHSSFIKKEFEVAKDQLKSAGKWGADGEFYKPGDPKAKKAKAKRGWGKVHASASVLARLAAF